MELLSIFQSLAKTDTVKNTVSAGFPSPAADYEEKKLDLNTYLIKNIPATFFVRNAGNGTEGAGIFSGDLLIVDRSVKPKNQNIVIASVDGSMLVRELNIVGKSVSLTARGIAQKTTRKFKSEEELSIWGVVTYVVHNPNK